MAPSPEPTASGDGSSMGSLVMLCDSALRVLCGARRALYYRTVFCARRPRGFIFGGGDILGSGDSREMSSTNELHASGDNLWVIEGPLVRDMGIMFATRMTVVKLADGSLWLESPVPLPFETIEAIAALGPVRYIVAATPRHVWRLETWHTLFPEAQLWTARPSPFTLGKAMLPFAGTLGDAPHKAWADDLDQIAFQGSPYLEEVIFLHRRSRTVVMGDLIQVHTAEGGKSLRNALLRLEGVAAPHGGVGLDIRLSFTNRGRARESLRRLLAWDFDTLIIAHGPRVEENAKAFVERAFRWLAR